MAEILRFSGQDGSFMLVEAARPERATASSDVEIVVEGKADSIAQAATRLESSLASVEGAAVALMDTVEALQKRDGGLGLAEVTLELTLSFGVEGGIVVAKGRADAQAGVTLTWRAHEGQ
jgi:predicted nucleotidyltransferase